MPRLSRAQEETKRRIADLAVCSLLPEQLGAKLLDALTHAIPNDGQRLFGLDPSTLLINRLLAASSSDDQARAEWLRDYYLIERSIPFMQFPTLMRANIPVVSMHDSQERCWGIPREMLYRLSPHDFYRSYHEGRTPVGGAIHVCLFAEGRWVAALQMYRRDARSPFRASDVGFVRLLTPTMGRALASALAQERALPCQVASPDSAGILILEADQRIRYSSPAGESWVELMRDTEHNGHDPLPTAVWSAIARLRAGVDEPAGRALIASTPSGLLRVETSSGGTDGSTVVVLSPEYPPAPPEIPVDWPMTRQEHRVTELVVRGLTNGEIATRLFVGEKTVESHLQHVYEKLNVRGRNQLIARFFQSTYLPSLSDTHAIKVTD